MMKEISFKQIMESEAYSAQKTIIQNEINWGDRNKSYFVERDLKKPNAKEFERLVSEEEPLANLKKKWKEGCRRKWGETWTKRSASRKHGEFHNRMN